MDQTESKLTSRSLQLIWGKQPFYLQLNLSLHTSSVFKMFQKDFILSLEDSSRVLYLVQLFLKMEVFSSKPRDLVLHVRFCLRLGGFVQIARQ